MVGALEHGHVDPDLCNEHGREHGTYAWNLGHPGALFLVGDELLTDSRFQLSDITINFLQSAELEAQHEAMMRLDATSLRKPIARISMPSSLAELRAERGTWYIELVDPFLRDDIERARGRAPAERMRIVLATVDEGLRIRRTMIRATQPGATEGEIDDALQKWLLRDEPTTP